MTLDGFVDIGKGSNIVVGSGRCGLCVVLGGFLKVGMGSIIIVGSGCRVIEAR